MTLPPSKRLFDGVSNPLVEKRLVFFLETVGKKVAEALRLTPSSFSLQMISMMKQDKSDIEILYLLYDFIRQVSIEKKNKRRSTSRVSDIEQELEWIRSKHHPMSSFSYLDIGCSEGSITEAVAEALQLTPNQANACDIIDCDFSKNKKITFIRNDGLTLPFKNDSQDLITMIMSAHHFSNVHEMFSEAYRVSKTGAMLIIREHCMVSTDKKLVEAAKSFYTIAHALYACTSISKPLPVESSPEEFMKECSNPEEYAHYRSIEEWTEIASSHGFILQRTPHGPIQWTHPKSKKLEVYGKDELFDSMYLVFQVNKPLENNK